MSPSAEQIVLETAKSPVLRAEFDRLRSATGFGQEPRFPRPVCDKLATLITTRNYSGSILQLCHLVCVARRLLGPGGYLFFFMEVETARHDCFRRQVADLLGTGRLPDALADEIELRRNGVGIRYPDGQFLVYFSQMPLLCGLLELLVNSLELEAVDAIFEQICDGPPSASGVSRGANQLSALLYDFLKQHLPTVHEQRKHRHLIAFMEKRYGSTFGAEEIDDEVVFDLWCSEAGNGSPFGTDFKLYKTVMKAFVLLRETLVRGRALYSLDHAAPVGQDWEGGEIDPGVFQPHAFEPPDRDDVGDALPSHLRPWVIEEIVDRIDGELGLLDQLAEPPMSRVKFLNQRERKDLGSIVEAGEQSLALPLSILRSEVFDAVQRRIGRTVEARGLAAIHDEPERSYQERRQRFDLLHEHLSRVTAATAHAIAASSPAQVVTGEDEPPPVADLDLWKKAQTEFNRLNRAGFDTSSLSDPEVREAFELATDPLLAILDRLTRYRARLSEMRDWETLWEQDKQRFTAQFERLYGELSGEPDAENGESA